jgi:phage baseplate assembly protein W
MTAIYRGFSTHNRRKRFTLTDFDLVKQDIFNHFNIKKGEKLMQPNFGTEIWDVMFDPLDANLEEAFMHEIKAVCGADPRVTVQNVQLTKYDYGLEVNITLILTTQNYLDVMKMRFDENSKTLSLA